MMAENVREATTMTPGDGKPAEPAPPLNPRLSESRRAEVLRHLGLPKRAGSEDAVKEILRRYRLHRALPATLSVLSRKLAR
jgi:hypothetical protein